jgi:transcriptional regulator with XRE-family HTH domain
LKEYQIIEKEENMFPNLNAEMARIGMTRKELAFALGRTTATMSQKLTGKTNLSLDEAFAIKKAIGTDIPLDELFAKKGE